MDAFFAYRVAHGEMGEIDHYTFNHVDCSDPDFRIGKFTFYIYETASARKRRSINFDLGAIDDLVNDAVSDSNDEDYDLPDDMPEPPATNFTTRSFETCVA